MPELVSVVLAVRDGERYIAEAIASVLAQAHRPIELLVVDGGSTDRTAEIVAGIPEARLLRQPGAGIPDAWNHGIRSARGGFVAFISHDDRWTPDKLAVQLELMRRRPDLLYTVGRVRFFVEPGERPAPGFRPELLEGAHVGRIMETLVARREAFATIGLLSGNPLAHDVDWYARAKDLGAPMAVVDEVILEKRVHGANSAADPNLTGPDLLDVLRLSIERQRGEEP
jgi:glycosyltransferase involved in cell wall biosynthesis